MSITYGEYVNIFSPQVVRVLLDGIAVGQFALLAEIQQLIRDKKYMLDLTTRLTK